MSILKLYPYVGPQHIIESVNFNFSGYKILKTSDIQHWITITDQELINRQVIATFVINRKSELLINDRHSEHVMCAGGEEVLSAGEISFYVSTHGEISVSEISNQSTGYCPEPRSWIHIAQVLETIGIDHPNYFTSVFEFRHCIQCRSINLIKEGIFECDICGADLPKNWNF